MLHLARKAFYPGKPPFPLLLIDTTWNFQSMYEFRDRHIIGELGMECLVAHSNEEGSPRASARSSTAARPSPRS